MNITAQYCGIILLFIILILYHKHKKLYLRTELAFQTLLYVTILCVALDIVSIVAITHSDILPRLLLDFICKSYLASLVCVGLNGLFYIRTDLYSTSSKYQKRSKIYYIMAAFEVCLIYLLPIEYSYNIETASSYSHGLSVLATYMFTFLFICITLTVATKDKQLLNQHRRTAVITWQLIWIVAALIQFIRNDLPLVSYASVVGIMLIYLMLENPDSNLIRTTGLFNQNALQQYLNQRYEDPKPFVMLVIILKHAFDNPDETHSKSQEIILQELAKYFLELPGVLAFQNSEDEIMILFEENQNMQKAWSILEKRFETGWTFNSTLIMPDWIYIPNCAIVKELNDLLYLIRYARTNMKELAESNFLLVDNQIVEKIQERKRVSKMLTEAMKENRVEVFLQPIFSCKENRFVSAEALVRIKDSSNNFVPPNVFIPVAEQTGKIIHLGKIIFEQVCQLIKENDLKQYGIHYIEVNLSTIQGAYEYLAADFINIMNTYNIDPSMINLEITETATLAEKRKLLHNMNLLMDYGVHFSLDDFGTGQSNLNYIIEMPVKIVKFDREMSNAYFNNGKAKYVMNAAIQMIHGMKLEIVSEGIETAEQYKVMEDMGINYIQGYYFSRPLQKEQFLEFIKSQNKINT